MNRLFALGLMLLSPISVANSTVSTEDVLARVNAIRAKLNGEQLYATQSKHIPAVNHSADTLDAQQRIATGEFLLFSIYLNENYLGEIFALKSDQDILLGLSGLVDILQLAINVDISAERAEGWFINTNKTFQLTAQKQLITDTKKWQLTEQQISVDDDIYIEAAVLAEALEFQHRSDYASLELYIETESVYPVVAQAQRHKKQLQSYSTQKQATLPWKPSPYQALSVPVADLQLNYTQDNEGSQASYSLLGSQDFAYLTMEYFLSGRESDLLNNSRLTFSKQDVNNQLLGPLAASLIEVGDVTATQVGSRYNNQYGRGVKISNYQLGQAVNNNRVNLTGVIQPGWDVELYRNGILIEQQLSLADGRYVFADVDLLFGENNFELIFYGPQGQVERKTEYYYIDGTQLEQGEAVYELSFSEQGKQLLGNNSNSANKGWVAAGRYQYGLSDNVAMYSGFMAQKQEQDELYHVALGTNLSLLDRLLVNLEYEENNQQQREFELTTRTKLADQSLLFSATNRTDNLNGRDITLKSYQFDMSGELMQNNFGRLNYQNNFLVQHAQSGDLKQIYNRLNYSYANVSINNLLQWQDPSAGQESVDGMTRLQTRLGRVYSRFGVNYRLSPVSEIASYEAEFSRSLGPSLQAELTLRDSLDYDVQSAELGLTWQNDRINLSSNVNYDSNDQWQIRLNSRFSFGFDSQYNQPFMSNRTLTNTGSLMVNVFLDENDNGIKDSNEKGLAGVKVKGLQNYRQAITDEQGIAILSAMPANRTTDIVLDRDSFADPFMIPAHDGFSITPRAGFVEYMDFPVNNASEIEGTVYQQTEQGANVQPYAQITLVDEQGNDVATTQAAYDGYYLFTDIKPGKYQAIVDKQYQGQKSLTSTQTHKIQLSPKGDVLVGVDITLRPLEKRQGYIASIGKFNSLKILKVYYSLVKQRLLQQGLKNAFYIHDKANAHYTLAVGYDAQSANELEQQCVQLISQAIKCHVTEQHVQH